MLELDVSKDFTAHSADSDEYVVEYQIESQRGFQVMGYTLYSSAALMPLDPAHFTSIDGKTLGKSLTDIEVPDDTWVWVWSQWYVDMTSDVDDQGWCYAWKFRSKHWSGRHRFMRSFVRQRIWKRPRVKRDLLMRNNQVGAIPHMPKDRPIYDESNDDLAKHPKLVANTESLTPEVPIPDESVASSEAADNDDGDGSSNSEANKNSKEQEEAELKRNKAESEAILAHLRKFRNDREMVQGIVDYISAHPEQHDLLVDIREQLVDLLRFPVSKRSLITKLSQSTNENCQLFILAPTNNWSGQVLRNGQPDKEPNEDVKFSVLTDTS